MTAELRAARERFLLDLNERCRHIEADILVLEGGGTSVLGHLRRDLHNLKGAAGMCGARLQAEICHQFEDFLAATGNGFDGATSGIALKFVDLLRDSSDSRQTEHGDDYLRHRLNALVDAGAWRSTGAEVRVVIIEPGSVCRSVCASAINSPAVAIDAFDNVLSAMTPLATRRTDMVVVASEITDVSIGEFLHFLESLAQNLRPERVVILGNVPANLLASRAWCSVLPRNSDLGKTLAGLVRNLGRNGRVEASV